MLTAAAACERPSALHHHLLCSILASEVAARLMESPTALHHHLLGLTSSAANIAALLGTKLAVLLQIQCHSSFQFLAALKVIKPTLTSLQVCCRHVCSYKFNCVFQNDRERAFSMFMAQSWHMWHAFRHVIIDNKDVISWSLLTAQCYHGHGSNTPCVSYLRYRYMRILTEPNRSEFDAQHWGSGIHVGYLYHQKI